MKWELRGGLRSRRRGSICDAEGVDPNGLVLHSDNGGPMKGATMVATLEALGVRRSLSRRRVSNDNPFAESLFRAVKGHPSSPDKAFAVVKRLTRESSGRPREASGVRQRDDAGAERWRPFGKLPAPARLA